MTRPLAVLFGMRYRLLWAHARSRVGRVTLLLVGYFLALLLITFLALGGLGAAVAGVRTGKAELVAQIVLASVFVYALLASAILGFGVNRVFSDATLRRYPLPASKRFAARHLIGVLEPLWLFVLALDMGVAIGLAGAGVASPWLALPAAVFLVGSNYLLARVLAAVVERVMHTRFGGLCLVAAVALLAMAAPALPMRAAAVASAMRLAMRLLKVTPPVAAAAAATEPALMAAVWLLVLFAWCLVFGWALLALDRHPVASRAVSNALPSWAHPFDRVAALFGPSVGPVVGKTLRYYLRSPQTKLNVPLALPGFVLMIAVQDTAMKFRFALAGTWMLAGFSTGALSLNMFGFDRGGFRRYFLLPVSPRQVFTGICTAAVLPGIVLIPFLVILGLLYSPGHTDARALVLLASSGLSGLFFFTTLGAWTSLLAPTPIEFDRTWGNKLSFPANAVMVFGILSFCGLLGILHLLGIDDPVLVAYWWIGPVASIVTAGALALSLVVGGGVFERRREKMLALIDVEAGI